MKPHQLTRKIIKIFGQHPNVYDVLDYYNILLIKINAKDFMAGYRYIKRTRVIWINQNLDDNLKRCVLWHEIGHALMHRTVNCFYMANRTRLRTMQYEVEAEQFVADLLLPEQIDDELEGKTSQEIAAYYGVTLNLVDMKWGNNFKK